MSARNHGRVRSGHCHQIGGDICVQYVPLNATTNCSRLMVRMYDTGAPTVLNQQFFTDPGAETLGIGTNKASACFRAESHVFNNEKILTSYGESIINKNSQWYGWYKGTTATSSSCATCQTTHTSSQRKTTESKSQQQTQSSPKMLSHAAVNIPVLSASRPQQALTPTSRPQ